MYVLFTLYVTLWRDYVADRMFWTYINFPEFYFFALLTEFVTFISTIYYLV